MALTAPDDTRVPSRALLPLFFIALTAVGIEIALTRFFAVANWSEYGYWVISIAMTGFAVSGVVMVLGREVFLRHAGWMQPVLPLALLLAGALGWVGVTNNPFNPLELQNSATWDGQLWNILAYYGALFPFFFFTGLAVSLNFVLYARNVGRVYGFDLIGAGLGAVLVLGLMFLLHPFQLIPAMLPFLAVAALFSPARSKAALWSGTLLTLLTAELLVVFFANPAISQYKPIYAPLNVPDSRVVVEYDSPGGFYQLLDNFTERQDTDFTNNAEILNLPAPPASLGLYRDGSRIAAIPRDANPEMGHVTGTLDSAPYRLNPQAQVLLLGAGGGFRPLEVMALGAAHVTVIEPEPVLHGEIRRRLEDPRAPAAVQLSNMHPLVLGQGQYDVIEIAGDFPGSSEQSRHAYTVEALQNAFLHLTPQGILSVPVPIRELPVYAVRVMASVRAALFAAGIADPALHVAVYRSAWNVRVLASRTPWTPERLAELLTFCDERSFDLSYAPGRDPSAERTIWNDLPAVSLENMSVEISENGSDAIAEEARAIFSGATPSDAFDRSPLTWDRPFMSPVVRLAALPAAFARVELLPQAEIGLLVNVAVLVQAIVLAVLVLLLPPLFRRGGLGVGAGMVGRVVVYFPALGLGFLLIEIYLIEYAALLMGDRTSGFALVLTSMLIFSGLGSMLAGRFAAHPRRALLLAVVCIVACCVLALLFLRPVILAALNLTWMSQIDLPPIIRAIGLVLAIAPVSVALGLPFPLGLDRFQQESSALLPWAWALNGAFSVIATPLANLLGIGVGLPALLVGGMLCYIAAIFVLPRVAFSKSGVALS